MKINLQNSYLVPSINFLQSIKLKGKESRSRSKLVKLLTKSLKALQEDENTLLDQYGERDGEGEFVKEENGNIKVIKKVEWQKEHRELLETIAEIEGGTYVNHIDDCKKILDDYDGELDGASAEAYDALLDAFEAQENTKKEGK